MVNNRGFRLSVTVNVLLFVLLLVVCLHERYVQRASRKLFGPPPKPYVHTDNPHFAEALDFDTLYHSSPAIVMFGNSMVQKMEWHELLGRCDVATRGVNGELTSGLLARVGDIIALHPRIVFIEGGINDIDHGVQPEQAATQLTSLANQLRSSGIQPVFTAVTQVTPFYPNSEEINTNIRRLNAALLLYANNNSLDFININPLIAPGGRLNPRFARADGCHLTAHAYYYWVKAIQDVLAKRRI